MTDETRNVLVDELLTMLGPPEHTDDVVGYLDRLAKMTGHFGQDVLTRAATQLVRRSENNRWPAPNEIVEACVDAQDAIAGRRLQSTGNEPWNRDARRARDWAREFCRSTELGLRAFREGWGRKVYEWAQSYAREHYIRGTVPKPDVLPTEDEVNYWVRNCRVPKNWLESERMACLREAPSPETKARLDAKIKALREGGVSFADLLKPMPVEDEEYPPMEIGKLPQRIKPEDPRIKPTDRDAWEARFGKSEDDAA